MGIHSLGRALANWRRAAGAAVGRRRMIPLDGWVYFRRRTKWSSAYFGLWIDQFPSVLTTTFSLSRNIRVQ